MVYPLLSRRTVLVGSLAVLSAGCQKRSEEGNRADLSCGNVSGARDDDADNQIGKRMKRVIGFWSWDADTRTMHRADGEAVRFVGFDQTRQATAVSLWMQFEVITTCGRVQLPVQQRLVDRDSNFRALWYKVDFRNVSAAAGVWAAAERLIADALACWPRGDLIDALPTGVGTVGGFSGGAFHPNMYRLYLPTYVGKPLFKGEVAPITGGQRWAYKSPSSAPSGAGRAIATLVAGTSQLTLREYQDGRSRLDYQDEAFGSDRFICSPPYAGQDWLWSIYESQPSNETHSRKSESLAKTLIAALRPKRRAKDKQESLTPGEQERAYSAIHEALFVLPPGAVRTEQLTSPPTVVKSSAPWLRAGYLLQDCLTAKELRGEQLQAAFADEPDAEALLTSPAGGAFDPATGVIHAPDGSSLGVERVDSSLGVTPTQLTLRCRASGLDWPIIVRRRDRRPHLIDWAYEPQLLSRWEIDHSECLQAWQREGHTGLPNANAWDEMRQFVEEAILSWGDGLKGGPAPQSLATTGGWYEGQWRGAELRRLLARPIRTGRVLKTDDWSPYVPAALWRRSDRTPANRLDLPGHQRLRPTDSPVPFSKVTDGDLPAHLSASGFIIRFNRDEQTVRHLVDYHGSGDHIRLGGTSSRLATAGILRIDEAASANGQIEKFPWPLASVIEQPNLQLWRRLRDAAEGGLRKGETATVIGGYFFDRFYSDSLRIIALSAELDDFDYRMFGNGNDFG